LAKSNGFAPLLADARYLWIPKTPSGLKMKVLASSPNVQIIRSP